MPNSYTPNDADAELTGPARHFPDFSDSRGLGSIKRAYSDLSFDEAPADFERADGPTGSWNYIKPAVGVGKIRIVFAVVGFGLVLMASRAAQLQIVQAAKWQELAEGNRSRVEWVPSERGIIYDRSGEPLVRNVPYFFLTMTPADLQSGPEQRKAAVLAVADILGVGPADIEDRLSATEDRPWQETVVGEHLTRDQAVLARIAGAENQAIRLRYGTRRDYVGGALSLSHILGYEGRVTEAELDGAAKGYLTTDLIGKTGIEKSYESTLRGKYGRRVVEIDAAGRRKETMAEEVGAPGNNLTLSIDLEMQKEAERILADRLKKDGKKRGALIAMRPDTGEVVALVSLPAYDANLFARGIRPAEFQSLNEDPDHPLFPRAISALLPSGSTFKPIVAAAALDEGVITPKTTVNSTGGIQYSRWFFPDWKAGGHGVTEVRRAIAESVNTFFYAVGGGWGDIVGLGPERIVAYAARFGLGEKLGIDLPNEAAGFLPSREWKEKTRDEVWYIGDTYHLAIGQGDILVTPIQIAAATSAIASGGKLVRPHVVHAVTAADGQRQTIPTEILEEQAASAEALAEVRAGMRQAVTSGSAQYLGDLKVKVAAKTGTAQWGTNKENHAWLTSFAPYDKPELVVTVVIEEGGEGSSTAAPVAKELYRWYFDK
jgi:penicillin-binding protein 2